MSFFSYRISFALLAIGIGALAFAVGDDETHEPYGTISEVFGYLAIAHTMVVLVHHAFRKQ